MIDIMIDAKALIHMENCALLLTHTVDEILVIVLILSVKRQY